MKLNIGDKSSYRHNTEIVVVDKSNSNAISISLIGALTKITVSLMILTAVIGILAGFTSPAFFIFTGLVTVCIGVLIYAMYTTVRKKRPDPTLPTSKKNLSSNGHLEGNKLEKGMKHILKSDDEIINNWDLEIVLFISRFQYRENLSSNENLELISKHFNDYKKAKLIFEDLYLKKKTFEFSKDIFYLNLLDSFDENHHFLKNKNLSESRSLEVSDILPQDLATIQIEKNVSNFFRICMN